MKLKSKAIAVLFILLWGLKLQARPLEFIAVGDTGKLNNSQKVVAESIGRYCKTLTCDYGLLLGDNLYQEGMLDTRDKRMDQAFKQVYEFLQFPFFVTLGNHDYGKLSRNWTRGRFQVEYSRRTPQFLLPSYWYYREFESVVLISLDTVRLMWDKDYAAQKQTVREALAKARGRFVVVIGHHPFLSNGKHGNAGHYERLSFPSFVSGKYVKRFFQEVICGKVDLYISGHDHSLQLLNGLQAGCDTKLVVSGAGASTDDLYKRNKTEFEANVLGFVGLSIDESAIRLKFINQDNQILHESKLTQKKNALFN